MTSNKGKIVYNSLTLALVLQDRTPLGMATKGIGKIIDWVKMEWNEVKRFIAWIAGFLGLGGVFLALDRAMKRSKVFRSNAKLIGTGVFIVL